MSGAPPLVARVLRGGRVESLHRVVAAATDDDGHLLGACGDARGLVFIRSAAKPLQAMPLLEAGGERAFSLTDAEIAITCASHGGEPRHVRTVARLLRKGDLDASDLACGVQRPLDSRSADALVAAGERPTALHNNCSGKHAGLLLACRIHGYSPRGYIEPTHPIQREVLARVARFAGVEAAHIAIAIDGCSLPVFGISFAALATAYARLLASEVAGEPPESRAARRRIADAMARRPEMVAGRRRFTTDFLAAGGGRWIGKEGAEGVYAVGLRTSPRAGGRPAGLAIKVEDGSTRPRDAATLALLEAFGLVAPRALRGLAGYRDPVLRNVAGRAVGRLETAFPDGAGP